MDRNKPIQMPFGDGNMGIETDMGHLYACYIADGLRYLQAKGADKDSLIMQIPLPLRWLLAQVMAPNYDKIRADLMQDDVRIMGVKCLPGYEARIVMYNPEQSFYLKNPMVVIDFEVKNGMCQRPMLRFVE